VFNSSLTAAIQKGVYLWLEFETPKTNNTMKKFFVILSLFAFILAVNVETATAATVSADVEYAQLDKDPTKASKKSCADSKTKANCTTTKDCGSKTAATSTQGSKGGCCSSKAKAACGDKGTSTAQATPEKE
jgi:hypothetical protein